MQWCPELFQSFLLYQLLCRFDRDLADEVQARGCPRCGGRLHRADFPRKPRGGPAVMPSGGDRRYDLCCAEEGCRHRVLPPSLRFFGRRVYLGPVFVLVSAMRQGLTRWSIARLRQLVGVSARTLRRWVVWWRTTFVVSPFWREKRGDLIPPVAEADLPMSLVERFTKASNLGRDDLVRVLRFLLPLTTSVRVG